MTLGKSQSRSSAGAKRGNPGGATAKCTLYSSAKNRKRLRVPLPQKWSRRVEQDDEDHKDEAVPHPRLHGEPREEPDVVEVYQAAPPPRR